MFSVSPLIDKEERDTLDIFLSLWRTWSCDTRVERFIASPDNVILFVVFLCGSENWPPDFLVKLKLEKLTPDVEKFKPEAKEQEPEKNAVQKTPVEKKSVKK